MPRLRLGDEELEEGDHGEPPAPKEKPRRLSPFCPLFDRKIETESEAWLRWVHRSHASNISLPPYSLLNPFVIDGELLFAGRS